MTLAFKKASGVKIGNLASISTDAAIANSRKTRSLRSAEVVRNIADFLAKHPALPSKKVPALVSALYDEKIPTGRGREWTVAALRKPLSYARKELAVRAEFEFDDAPFSDLFSTLPTQHASIETQASGDDANYYRKIARCVLLGSRACLDNWLKTKRVLHRGGQRGP